MFENDPLGDEDHIDTKDKGSSSSDNDSLGNESENQDLGESEQ